MEEKPVILVVEDEVLIRMAAVQMLEVAGFAVLEAANAHHAGTHVAETDTCDDLHSVTNPPTT